MKRIKHLFHLCKESLFHGIYPISFSSHKSECETLGVKLTLGIKDEPGAARLELEDQELLLPPCWSCKQQQAISLLRLKLQADTCHIVCAWLYEPFKHVQLGPQVPILDKSTETYQWKPHWEEWCLAGRDNTPLQGSGSPGPPWEDSWGRGRSSPQNTEGRVRWDWLVPPMLNGSCWNLRWRIWACTNLLELKLSLHIFLKWSIHCK